MVEPDPTRVQFFSSDRVAHLWARVDRDDGDGCWLWRGAKSKGYGQARIDGRVYYVHRLLFEAERGPVPEGLELDHLCRVRWCVRPSHLEPVTPAENTRRMRAAVDPD